MRAARTLSLLSAFLPSLQLVAAADSPWKTVEQTASRHVDSSGHRDALWSDEWLSHVAGSLRLLEEYSMSYSYSDGDAWRVRYGRRSCPGRLRGVARGGLSFKRHMLTYLKIEYQYLTVSIISFKKLMETD